MKSARFHNPACKLWNKIKQWGLHNICLVMLASLQYHNSLFPVQWWGGNLKTVQCKVKPFCGWVWKCVSSCKVTDWCDSFLFVMPGLQAEQSHTKITQKVTQSTKGLDFKNIKRRFKKAKKKKPVCTRWSARWCHQLVGDVSCVSNHILFICVIHCGCLSQHV